MNRNFLLVLPLFLLSIPALHAQPGSLAATEARLHALATDVLNHDSLSYKIEQNKQFANILIDVLQRPESFNYPFDSLKTVSVLEAEDRSFRIFTWHIVDKNKDEYYGEQYHYFFGVVQRKYQNPQGKTEYLVIPLVEMQQLPRDVENRIFDNNQWVGALYYPLKNKKYLPKYKMKYDMGGKKEKGDFYLLLGWNGNDNRSNYKMVETISFDPKDKNRVIFGANVFYFDALPKARALFKYSDYAPFTLNFSYTKSGPGKWFKKEMIVYDHLADPFARGGNKPEEIWSMGPDGSYDALSYYKRGGYFEWYRNVELAEKFNNKVTQKYVQELQARELEKLKAAGIDGTTSNRPGN